MGLRLLSAIGAPAPFVSIDWLQATGNALDGVRVGANSNLSSVKGNALLGNGRAGLSVRDYSGDGTGVVLNGGASPNTLQSTSQPNAGGGLCFDTFQTFSVTIDAQNTRFGTADCSISVSPAPTLSHGSACAGGVDVGGVRDADGGGAPNPVHVQLSHCEDL
jgi:hypothetical protein